MDSDARRHARNRRAIAFHEVGHAVAAVQMPFIGHFLSLSLPKQGKAFISTTVNGETLNVGGLCECPGFELDLSGAPLEDYVCGDAERLAAKRELGRQHVIVLMAACFAEARYRKVNPVRVMLRGGHRDMDRARSIALWLFPGDESGASTFLLEAAEATHKLVRKEWPAITTLAEALLERGTVDGEDPIVEALFAATA